jgi:hypothetical protein
MSAFLIVICISVVVALLFIGYGLVTSWNETPPRGLQLVDLGALEDEDLQAALAKGNKAKAIRRYRELTGAGFKAARYAVEFAIESPNSPEMENPELSHPEPDDSGVRSEG